MSQNNYAILYVGLDVAKNSLQLDLAGQAHSLSNDAKGHARLRKWRRAPPTAQVVCEASGGYEKPVVRALQAAQVPLSLLEAGPVRHFARAKGLRAKTDAIDAPVLSEYGRVFRPAPTAGPTAQQARLPNCPPGGSHCSKASSPKPTARPTPPTSCAYAKGANFAGPWRNRSISATWRSAN